MPDLNSRGGMALGQTISWLDDDTLIGQIETAPTVWEVCTRPADSPFWTPTYHSGASMIAARAGHWIGFLAGTGIFWPGGGHEPAMGLAGDIQAGRGVAADDGTIGVILNQDSGVGLRLQAADGSVADIPDARPIRTSVYIVDRTRAGWQDSVTGEMRTCGGLPVPKMQPGPVYWPKRLIVHGCPWLTYHSIDALGVILHPEDDASRGYNPAKPFAGYLSAVVLDDSRVKLAWSSTPNDLSGHDLTIDVAHDPQIPLGGPNDPGDDPMPVPDPALVLAALKIERAKYGTTLTAAENGALLNAVAWQFPSCGLHKKTDSNSVPQPRTGVLCNRSILRYLPPGEPLGVWADVLGAAGTGLCIPQAPDWKPSSDGRETFVIAVKPEGVIDPPATTDLEKRVTALEQHMAALEASAIKAGSHVALQTDNGHFVCAEGGGGGAVVADRTQAAGWETFTVGVQS